MRFDRDNQSLPVPADLLVVKEATDIDTGRVVWRHWHPAPDINTLWTIPGWRCLKLYSQKWCNCNQASQDADSHHTVHARDEASNVFHEVASPPNEHKQWLWVRCSRFCLICEIIKDLSLSSTESSCLKLLSSPDLSQVLNLTRVYLCKMNSKSWSGTSSWGASCASWQAPSRNL